MVKMASKFAGKCRTCGRAILPGSAMDWTKEGGARHLSAEECAAAPMTVPPVVLRRPQDERPEDRERATRLLLSQPWKVAKTMPKIPHEYTLRRLWVNDEDFIWTVEHLRATGYEQLFGGRVYTYYDIAEYQYFPCDGETRGLLAARTTVTLINRAPRKASTKPSAPTLGLE